MGLNEKQSEKILSCYFEKAIKKEWRDVHTKYGVHQQRYGVKTNVGEEKEKHPFGGDSGRSAALKDAVFHGIKYNGKYYDKDGDRIPLTKEQEQYANKMYDEKGRMFLENPPAGISKEDYEKGMKKIALEKRNRLIPIINEKEQLYEKELEKLNKERSKLNDNLNHFKTQLKNISGFFKSMRDPKAISNILYGFDKTLKNKTISDFDAEIIIKYKGKEHDIKRNLKDFADSLFLMERNDPIEIKNIEIKGIDNLTLDDFNKLKMYNKEDYNPTAWERAAKKYNKNL